MNHDSRKFAVLAAVCAFGLVACDQTGSTTPIGESPIAASTPARSAQATLDAEIRSLVTSGFPKGHATSILAKWDQVLKSLAKDPKTTLKGKVVPGSGGRTELTRTISFVGLKAAEVTPPAGETKAHFVARLILDMSLYVYGGPSTPVPSFSSTSDVAYKLVQPTSADTVVTPAKQAAVVFPVGSVVEPTIVVITPDTTYYPANCSGPLDTTLCQYPRFYHYNVFPDVKLNLPAKVQVCHVDAGANRLPLADHDRFRVAHEKPANPSNYSAGSTIVDNVEVLAYTVINVTDCTAGGGTQYSAVLRPDASRYERAAFFAQGLARRVASAARTLLLPKDAYAIDIGGGGEADFFSMFGVVDPQSKADLAQSPSLATQFHPTVGSITSGNPLPLAAWNITNLGSGTSGAFTSSIVVANDSLLTSVVSSTSLGGAASLVPQAVFTYGAQSITMPATPGTYFVGTRVIPVGTDSTAVDDLVSVPVVVNAAAPVCSAPWTCAGPGITSATVTTGDVALFYNHTPSSYSLEQWTFSRPATTTGTYNFNWTYSGLHSWYSVTQALEVFADGPTGTTTVPLVNVYIAGSAGNFSYSGSASLPLTAGYAWGVRPSGQHFDSSQILTGTVHIIDP